jgi:predicted glycoside hydrolase/deacetylase ChbG (UPF0249 family)
MKCEIPALRFAERATRVFKMTFSRLIYFLFVCVLISVRSLALAEPWSEQLGFPPGQKVLIIDAQEMGVMWEMNEAGKELLENQRVSSVGILTTGPWFNDFASWCRQHPRHDFGVSVALTNPYSAIQWSLMSPAFGPSTLVDADGNPWKTVVQLAASVTADDVKRELDAQIDAARKAGVPLSHIGGYYGTVFSRQDLAAVFLGAARKYWLPAPVVELTPELSEKFRRQGFPLDETMVELISNYPLPKLDDLKFMAAGETYPQKKANFISQIKTLAPGLTQIVCRPAVESRGLQLLSDEWQQRVWEAQVLADEEVQQAMQQAGVALTDWREIMERFEHGETTKSGADGSQAGAGPTAE